MFFLQCVDRWGILHTEKFWKENAKFMEKDNFAILKELIALLNSADQVSLKKITFTFLFIQVSCRLKFALLFMILANLLVSIQTVGLW